MISKGLEAAVARVLADEAERTRSDISYFDDWLFERMFSGALVDHAEQGELDEAEAAAVADKVQALKLATLPRLIAEEYDRLSYSCCAWYNLSGLPQRRARSASCQPPPGALTAISRSSVTARRTLWVPPGGERTMCTLCTRHGAWALTARAACR